MNIKCKKLTETAIIPTRATSGSAGYDMYSDETVTIKIPSENKDTQEIEQFFSNGITKVYEPAKITFLTGSLGFEYYLGQRFAINLLGNYDYIKINDNKLNNYSATIGIRQFF